MGRTEELERLTSAFPGHGPLRQIVLLYGLGGIGKTQLAVTFIKNRSDLYSAIFWLKGHSEDRLRQSFTLIAKRVHDEYPSFLPIRKALETNDVDEIVGAVKKWLSLKRNSKWMLVIDNVDDQQAYDVGKYLPQAYHGSILLTSRSSQRAQAIAAAITISVEKLIDTSDSIAILSHMSGRSISAQGKFPPLKRRFAS